LHAHYTFTSVFKLPNASILVQIQEPVLCATLVQVIARVAPTPGQLMSVLVAHQGRGQPPVWRPRPMPSSLYWRLRIPRPPSVWLSGWSESGVEPVASILHRYTWLSNSGPDQIIGFVSACASLSFSVHVACFITKKGS
jgi:hypothetical protein